MKDRVQIQQLSKRVKLQQLSQINDDRSEITFKLTFPANSLGPLLFLEFIEYKKDYFKGNIAFSVTIEKVDETPEINMAIRMNWVREIAQECHHYIKTNI